MLRRGATPLRLATLALLAVATTGCPKSETPIGGKSKSSGETHGSSTEGSAEIGLGAPKGWEPAEEDGERWVGYPNVPHVPVLTEVDGIEISRVAPDPGDFVPGGEVPVDVDNPAAEGNPTEPVTGGSVTIRFNAEPKSLNMVVGADAYQQYVAQYVQDALAYQNPETFEYEPAVAEKWIVEDSVKLRPDFEGRERRVAQEDGEPATSLSVDVGEDGPGSDEPLVLLTTDAAGEPVGKAWVGFRPTSGEDEKLQHFWSNDEGRAEAVGLPPGSYDVLVGDELYGTLEDTDDGYQLTSLADESAEPIALAETDVIDVQRETVFTYDLRDDVTWSDGEPFTTDDLLFAYAVINNRTVDGDSIRIYYQNLVDCEALGPHRVRMKYREQYFKAFEFTYGLAALAPPWHLFQKYVEETGKTLVMERLTPEEEQAQDKWSVHGAAFGKFFNEEDRYNTRPLGIGPYVITEWSRQDKRLTLTRRDDYWNDENGGYLDRIIVRFIEDNPTALRALEAGEIDFFWRVNAEQFFEELAGPPTWVRENFVKKAWYSPGFRYVGWNLNRPMFQDRRVRLALAMLFDKNEFFEKKVHGAGVLVSGSQYFFGPAYDHTVNSVGYDPSAARNLLAEAGWIDSDGDGVLDRNGRPFRFVFLTVPGNPTTRALAEILQSSYRRAGIDVDVQELEWATFLERIYARNFDAVTLAWASPLESDPYQIWHGSQAAPELRSSNHVGFRNDLADQLIEQAQVTLDDEERKRIFYSFHRLLDREQPYLFLWNDQDLGVYHQKFRGVKFYALRPGFDLREWYIPKELQ